MVAKAYRLLQLILNIPKSVRQTSKLRIAENEFIN